VPDAGADADPDAAVPDAGGTRATLSFIECPASHTTGHAKPLIERCFKDDTGAVRKPLVMIRQPPQK
jgi:hypothetical protein